MSQSPKLHHPTGLGAEKVHEKKRKRSSSNGSLSVMTISREKDDREQGLSHCVIFASQKIKVDLELEPSHVTAVF
jgi:hypothetical protein